MAKSSLLGIDEAPATRRSRDTASLGPSDTSDSGADLMGLEDDGDLGDPGLPVDVAMRDDQPHAFPSADALAGIGADATGTGERASAVPDGPVRDGADIGVDRVFQAGGAVTQGELDALSDEVSDDEDADLGFIDNAQAADLLADEDRALDEAGGEDEAVAAEREPVSRRARGRRGAAQAHATPPEPRHAEPEPDAPAGPREPADEDDLLDTPSEPSEVDERSPGRTRP